MQLIVRDFSHFLTFIIISEKSLTKSVYYYLGSRCGTVGRAANCNPRAENTHLLTYFVRGIITVQLTFGFNWIGFNQTSKSIVYLA